MNSTKESSLAALQREVLAFRNERDWKQFHSLRHLIVSLNLEASELLELTQWKSDAELEAAILGDDGAAHEALRDECADVLAYLLLIADAGNMDLAAALREKLEKNAQKYPVEKSRGSKEKYTQLK
ncbi:MAG: nucleotide pyrophosphohydrolase [Betaproteobacteria bacterium]|nr:nucleotide pyrophosphohydrolase [Betaproteobacteria bacterium]